MYFLCYLENLPFFTPFMINNNFIIMQNFDLKVNTFLKKY
ncbi:hypothetical protein BVAVS116_H0063 (plasmid) [Borreliella valaisiana VS116]|uniref:Uncharacterized protein n=1 Tax=Borreliella valaisiana VS116 TaxID=445987 RepID=C0R9C0_BORVA|nr:hypothetical protein BVAVS116_H0063 [Borreliella valaisiana VS116]